MNRPFAVAASLIGMCLAAGTGFAMESPFDSGNDFLQKCGPAVDAIPTNKDPNGWAGTCYGWIFGAVEMHNLIASAGGEQLFCYPKDAPVAQALRVLVKSMENHPETLDKPAILIATGAFIDAWPCAAKPNTKPK